MQIAIEKGRKTRPDIKLGICGEHGGEPSVGGVLPPHRSDLRKLQSVPRPRGASGRGPGGAARPSSNPTATGK